VGPAVTAARCAVTPGYAALLAGGGPASAQEAVDFELVLAVDMSTSVDGSDSVDGSELDLQG
jgi:hypothetical protein